MERYCCQDHISEYSNFFQKGKGIGYIPPFIGVQHQRGYGIGSIFSFLARSALKLAKPALKTALKLARPAGKHLAKQALRRGKKVGLATVQGILEGKDPLQLVKDVGKRQLKELGLDTVKYASDKFNNEMEYDQPGSDPVGSIKYLSGISRKRKGSSVNSKAKIKRKLRVVDDILS